MFSEIFTKYKIGLSRIFHTTSQGSILVALLFALHFQRIRKCTHKIQTEVIINLQQRLKFLALNDSDGNLDQLLKDSIFDRFQPDHVAFPRSPEKIDPLLLLGCGHDWPVFDPFIRCPHNPMLASFLKRSDVVFVTYLLNGFHSL